MIPILYAPDESNFNHGGIGALFETTSCVVEEERNGAFEIEFKYPVNGHLYKYIEEGCLVKAKPNDTAEPQLFSVYRSAKPINGIVTFYGEHISYELSGNPVENVEIENATAQDAMAKVFAAALLTHNYTPYSDITTPNSTSIARASVRGALGGVAGSLLSVWGGEYEFDNFTVKLHSSRGTNTGVKIAYGKNLTDLQQEKNISEVYVGVYPYAKYTPQAAENATEQPEEVVVSLSEKIIWSPHAAEHARKRVCIKDFSDHFNGANEITEEQLREVVEAWVKTSGFDVPTVNITVSFVHLWHSPEYAQYALLERVNLCDTVSVEFSKLGVSATAKVIKTRYDVLNEKYLSITLGSAKANFADTVNQTSAAIEQTKQEVKQSAATLGADIKKAVDEATQAITGQSGGYVVLNPSKNPQEILIMDEPTIAAAKNIWRWNSGGFGHSKNGYNGPFETAITQDGAIVADFITVGKVATANIDVAGVIQAGGIAVLGDVQAEAKRASDAEGALSSRITATAEQISAEVTRAQNSETVLSSRITANADAITAKVNSKGGADASFSWELTTSGFCLKANNTQVMSVTQSGLEVVGKITAQSGEIGGWTISTNEIYKGSAGINAGSGYTKASLVTTGTSAVRFYAGNGNRADGKFVVLDDGSLYASAANIEGTITATSGVFSNCTIDDSCTINGTITANKICANEGAYDTYSATGDISFVGGTSTSIAQYIMRVTNAQNTRKKAYMCVYDVQGSMNAAMSTISTNSSGYLTTTSVSIVDTTVIISGESLVVSPPISARSTLTVSGKVTMNGGFTGRSSAASELRHTQYLGETGGNYAFLQFYRNSYGDDFLACSMFHNYDNAHFYIYSWNNGISIGAASGYESDLVGTWRCNGSLINSSDKNAKNSITDIGDAYEALFDSLRPRMYKYNDGTSDRLHSGFIAQEVDEALTAAGLTTKDFAAVCIADQGKETESWGLRYEEFVALNTREIQKLKARVAELEKQLST